LFCFFCSSFLPSDPHEIFKIPVSSLEPVSFLIVRDEFSSLLPGLIIHNMPCRSRAAFTRGTHTHTHTHTQRECVSTVSFAREQNSGLEIKRHTSTHTHTHFDTHTHAERADMEADSLRFECKSGSQRRTCLSASMEVQSSAVQCSAVQEEKIRRCVPAGYGKARGQLVRAPVVPSFPSTA